MLLPFNLISSSFGRSPRAWQLILMTRRPDGQITISCPAVSRKIFRFRRRANHLYKLGPSHPNKRRIAIVTKRAVGCGGRGSVGHATGLQGGSAWSREREPACRRTALKRTAKPCGPGTRCWCQVGGGVASPTGFGKTANSPTTATRGIRRRGEPGGNR
jgi:hypothetical protein